MKRYIDVFVRAVMTGVAIGIGGIVYLSCDNKYIGAALFGTGLFVILSFSFNLYTGKVGYAVEQKLNYLIDIVIIWFGNLCGTVMTGLLVSLTRIDSISEKAAEICEVKLSDTPISIFVLAFFCGILMFIAADGYKTIDNAAGRYLAVFLPVVVFILSGFEHCIANMFYFTLAEVWSVKALGYLAVMTAGNAAGGIVIPAARKLFINK